MLPTTIAAPLLALLAAPDAAPAPGPAPAEDPAGDPTAEAERVVERLYELVTFGPGATLDRDAVRELFLPEAVVVLRSGRERMSVFTLDGFVADFVAFAEDAGVRANGFAERILARKAVVYGDLAHVLVRFDSHVPGSGRPPQEGLDSFQLVRVEGRWRIACITNERPTPERPLPAELFE